MKTFLSDLIPKIQRYSKHLDDLTLLTNQHWVVIDEVKNSKLVYIFRGNNELLISKDGKVEKGKWEILLNNSILLETNDGNYLMKHGFFDENILALKIDGKLDYALLVNENNINGEFNSAKEVFDYLENKYVNLISKTIFNNSSKYYLSTENSLEMAFDHKYQGNHQESILHFHNAIIHNLIDRSLGYYNIACCFSLSEQEENSYNFLRRATRIGYKNFNMIKNDKDLIYIRSKPDFNKVYLELDLEQKSIRNDMKSRSIATTALDYIKKNELQNAILFFNKALKYNKLNFIIYYNLACTYTLNQEFDLALDCLKTSIKFGYYDKSNILNDLNLTKLRHLKAFDDLIDEYDKYLDILPTLVKKNNN